MVLPPAWISAGMLGRRKYNLNLMSHDTAIAMIRRVIDVHKVNVKEGNTRFSVTVRSALIFQFMLILLEKLNFTKKNFQKNFRDFELELNQRPMQRIQSLGPLQLLQKCHVIILFIIGVILKMELTPIRKLEVAIQVTQNQKNG